MRLLLLLLLPTSALAQEVVVQPYLQLVTPTSAVVRWETDSSAESTVEWGADSTLGSATVGTWWDSAVGSTLHEVELTGLTPGAKAWYRVVSGAASAGPFDFVTPPLPSAEAPVRLIAVSDMQRDSGNPTVFEEIVQQGVIPFAAAELGPDLPGELSAVLVPGDLVDNGWTYSQFADEFFEPAAPLFRHVPVYPVPGNHEADTPFFFDYFSLPDNGGDEHWWFHDIGNVRVIGLDSNFGYTNQDQLDWLEATLDDTCGEESIDFVFAQLHHPFKSELWLPGENLWSGSVVERMEAFTTDCGKPSIHFFGHTHGYSRGQSRDHQHLWVNVATAGGNIDYWGEYAQNDYDEFVVSQDEWGFVLVEVEAGDAPQFRLRRVSHGNEDLARDNEVRDDLTIRRFNQLPATPRAIAPSVEPVSPDGLTLIASEYEDPDGDAHQGSHWQVAPCGGFDTPVSERWIQDRNEYGGQDLATGELTDAFVDDLYPETDYCWRVRYRDAGLAWSAWSDEQAFTTGPSEFTENLLVNPGAEEGIEGWTPLFGPIESLAEGECDGLAPRSGDRYFAVGGMCEELAPVAEAVQSRGLILYTAPIDAGRASARLRGWLSDWGGDDEPALGLQVFDEDDVLVAEWDPVGVLSTEWTQVEIELDLPPGSRRIQVRLIGTHGAGDDSDCYFDDLELVLRFSDPPAPDDPAPAGDDVNVTEACGCPEPSAALLLPLGLLGLRRKRR